MIKPSSHSIKSITLRAKLEETDTTYILRLSPSGRSDLIFTLELPKPSPQALQTIHIRALCIGFLSSAYGHEVSQEYTQMADEWYGQSYWLKFQVAEDINREPLRMEVDTWQQHRDQHQS